MNLPGKKPGIAMVLGLGLLVGGVASATPTTLDFGGLTPATSVRNYYNGGCSTFFGFNVDCDGTNYGVAWQGATVVADPDAPSSPNFVRSGLFASLTMNVAAGFDGALSFYYSTPLFGRVDVYRGLNGQGTLLSSLFLPSTSMECLPRACWAQVGTTFSGVARSAIFDGFVFGIGLDNVTLGAGTPTPAPEPAALGLFGLGALLIGGFVALRRRGQPT